MFFFKETHTNYLHCSYSTYNTTLNTYSTYNTTLNTYSTYNTTLNTYSTYNTIQYSRKQYNTIQYNTYALSFSVEIGSCVSRAFIEI